MHTENPVGGVNVTCFFTVPLDLLLRHTNTSTRVLYVVATAGRNQIKSSRVADVNVVKAIHNDVDERCDVLFESFMPLRSVRVSSVITSRFVVKLLKCHHFLFFCWNVYFRNCNEHWIKHMLGPC